jgi:acyl-CoA thioesterase FadM
VLARRLFRELGIALLDGLDDAAAQGHFVHVYVDRATNKPVPLPDALRKALERIVRSPGDRL